jgi:hypothetical protein
MLILTPDKVGNSGLSYPILTFRIDSVLIVNVCAVQSPKLDVQRTSRQQTVMNQIEQLDNEHEARLRAVRAIGRVVNSPEPSMPSMNYRRVNFRWQRGTKIGRQCHCTLDE